MTPQRADARRNREALLVSAGEVYAEQGPDVALDVVARHAGVSIATLYRHFANREALVAELYRQELVQLARVDDLLAQGDAVDAFEAWTARFVGYADTKQALGEVLHALPDDERPSARAPVVAALDALLEAGRSDGTLRAGLDAEDVLNAFAGLWRIPSGPHWRVRAERLAAVVVEGLRAR